MASGIILGVEDLSKRLNKISAELKAGIKNEIQASGQTIAAEARGRVPRDTGLLGNSISSYGIEEGTEIVAQKEYAAYVEFGTGALVDVPAGLEDYAIQFKGAGVKQVNLPARPYMFPSYFEEKPKLIKRIVEKLDKA